MHAVVTARVPQYETIERFDAGSMEVRLFDTQDEATEWAIQNPNYITEVVPVQGPAAEERCDFDCDVCRED
jgi:hypothetical protein